MKYQYKKAPCVSDYTITTGLAEQVSDLKTIAKDIPCQNGCPAKTNVPGYIEQIAQGNNDAAYRINLEDNVFPGALGRICVRPCESECRHNWTNIRGPVTICHLKRVSADHHKETFTPLPAWFDATGKKVAVVGGGPAGLAAARNLKRYGHDVTLFEKENYLGGMMVDGIPKFRLPRDIVNQEIDLIVDSGIEVKTGKAVDRAQVETLAAEYDAVLMAAGTMVARNLSLEGAKEEHLISGLKFMKEYNNGEVTQLKGDVVIIGGGFTAVDCARSCARAAKQLVGDDGNVSIYYRRTEQHMAADLNELEEIENENITVRTLSSPVGVKTDESGTLKSVVFIRNKIGKPEAGGKPKITPVEGSEFEVPCDHLVVAIGQTQDWDILPEGVSVSEDNRSNNEKIFSAGDYRTGSMDVIHAVADGKAAADAIDTYLMGSERINRHVWVEATDVDGETGRYREHDQLDPDPMPLLDIPGRAKDDAEVELGFTKEGIHTNAFRCYLCHYKLEINHDKCIQCNWCVEVTPRECISRVARVFKDKDGYIESYMEADLNKDTTYIHMDSNNCVRCGKCLRVCPTGAITMRKATRTACKVDGSGCKTPIHLDLENPTK